jgi:hypothetical protein
MCTATFAFDTWLSATGLIEVACLVGVSAWKLSLPPGNAHSQKKSRRTWRVISKARVGDLISLRALPWEGVLLRGSTGYRATTIGCVIRVVPTRKRR